MYSVKCSSSGSYNIIYAIYIQFHKKMSHVVLTLPIFPNCNSNVRKKICIILQPVRKKTLISLKSPSRAGMGFGFQAPGSFVTIYTHLYPYISMHILRTDLFTIPMVLTRRICEAIKGFFFPNRIHLVKLPDSTKIISYFET